MQMYEVQVLDSYNNDTYADGMLGSVYGQWPPLFNAAKEPGDWQSYDIVFTAPRFDDEGGLLSPAKVTVFLNGVAVQANREIEGPITAPPDRPVYREHPGKMPLLLQDHLNPVRFRNIWIVELPEVQ
jgi:hypothetical protein